MTAAVEPKQQVASAAPAAMRVLLLTGTAPGEPGVGGVILKDLIRQTGVDRWHCCWLASKYGAQQPYWSELPTTVQRRQYETAYRPIRGLLGEMVSALAMRVCRAPMIEAARKTMLGLIRDTQPDFILAVLDSAAVIETVRQLQQTSPVPVRCLVWDDVDVFCRQRNLDRWTQSRIAQAFGRVLQASERTAVICENMQAEYRRRYGIDSFVLRHGISAVQMGPNAPSEGARNEYRIGFAGSITAPDCLRMLIDGLDSIAWQINGRDVVLRLLGARYLLDSRKPQRIEYYGWRSVEETCARLSECDLLYLPQSFTEENRMLSELSFPTKLSTYLAVQRPILLHAPEYASLTGFWQQYPVGPASHARNAGTLLPHVIDGLQANHVRTAAWVEEVIRASEHALGPKQFDSAVQYLVTC